MIFLFWMMLMEPVDAPARWWPWSCLIFVYGLRRLDKTGTFWFLSCIHVFDLVLKYCSDIIEGNWLQLLFHFFVLMGIVSWDIGMSFFLLCFKFLIEVFSFCPFTETFAIGFQTDLKSNRLILKFFFAIWLSSLISDLYGLKSARIA